MCIVKITSVRRPVNEPLTIVGVLRVSYENTGVGTTIVILNRFKVAAPLRSENSVI